MRNDLVQMICALLVSALPVSLYHQRRNSGIRAAAGLVDEAGGLGVW